MQGQEPAQSNLRQQNIQVLIQFLSVNPLDSSCHVEADVIGSMKYKYDLSKVGTNIRHLVALGSMTEPDQRNKSTSNIYPIDHEIQEIKIIGIVDLVITCWHNF